MDSTLIVYVLLTFLVLYSAARQLAPVFDHSLDECLISYVYDGDTVELDCNGTRQTARLFGFDTPETKSPGCDAEARLGELATKRLRNLVSHGNLELSPHGREKYGRLLAALHIDGRDVGQVLIEEGFAVSYRGGSRINWCDRLG